MTDVWRKAQAATKSYLWLSWATAAWALLSYLLLHSHARLPQFIELLTALGRGFALLGGVLALLYLLIGARTAPLVISAAVAAAVNFWYCWNYLRSLFGAG